MKQALTRWHINLWYLEEDDQVLGLCPALKISCLGGELDQVRMWLREAVNQALSDYAPRDAGSMPSALGWVDELLPDGLPGVEILREQFSIGAIIGPPPRLGPDRNPPRIEQWCGRMFHNQGG